MKFSYLAAPAFLLMLVSGPTQANAQSGAFVRTPDGRAVVQPAVMSADAPVQYQNVVRHRRHRRYTKTTSGQRYYANSTSPRYVTRRRSKKKSAAIVAGSAAAGAGIGALAGGGKGAAIGAAAGGASGLVYDRATHKKTVVVP